MVYEVSAGPVCPFTAMPTVPPTLKKNVPTTAGGVPLAKGNRSTLIVNGVRQTPKECADTGVRGVLPIANRLSPRLANGAPATPRWCRWTGTADEREKRKTKFSSLHPKKSNDYYDGPVICAILHPAQQLTISFPSSVTVGTQSETS